MLKQFLLNRSLNEVYTGGLGSYGLILLCVSFFQMHPMIQSGLINPGENLGVLLVEFFELFGKCLNYEKVGISVLSNGSYFRKEDRKWMQPKAHLLSVEDPYDTSNDVTKNSFSISIVKQAFQHAYDILSSLMVELKEDARNKTLFQFSGIPSILSTIISVPQKVATHRFYIERLGDGTI